jgi:hypothetical protein
MVNGAAFLSLLRGSIDQAAVSNRIFLLLPSIQTQALYS